MGPFAKLLAVLLGAIGCASAFSGLGCSNASREGPPNVVLVVADDLGWGDVGVQGAVGFETPNIDRLAAEGMRFTDAHSTSGACSPSRYALLTGRYAWRRNLWGALLHRSPLAIDPERTTLADLAKRAGYVTAAIGKWHLGFGEEEPDWNGRLAPGPLELGFDHYFGIPVVNSHPPFVYVEDHRVWGLDPADPLRFTGGRMSRLGRIVDWAEGGEAARALYKDSEIARTLSDHAVAFIEQNAERPFLLYLATTHVHLPLTPAPEFHGRGTAGVYGAFVTELDWMVGRLMDALDAHGLADDTLFVFTSDNGAHYVPAVRRAWRAGHRPNGPWLGQKFGVWEGAHRVPFIARWPGKVPAGAVSDALVSLVDLPATLAALTGQALPDDAAEDSFDLLPALREAAPEPPPRDHLVLASATGLLALRQGDHVFIDGPGSGGFGWRRHNSPEAPRAEWQEAFAFTGRPNSELRPDGRFRPGAAPVQLYDLARDPGQSTNLVGSDPARARRMFEALRAAVVDGRTRPAASPPEASEPAAPARQDPDEQGAPAE